ncbi:DUF1002 domain-containing protein [Anaerosalibacter sp. Marseille-P3206]|uniref:DUF1002 domain-containing protein n=1 Tax=Anaerosalibacter sp. Marseille-P3206 TaxID=1871005 RepID=UPI00098741DA|nr:DUF1002 domain-containing protein [Anaerosalibacter sp. Marseille-P3206]
MFKRITSTVLVILLLISNMALADQAVNNNKVICLGQNLSQAQKKDMLNLFGADESVEIVEVTNKEEREYLGKYIDEKILGTRAISSAYVEKLNEGEGISVVTHNISWVTEDMYKNALITAGIKDAKIIVASPVNVSGTAALTGVIKAFEDLTGEDITEKEKEVASEEIAKTAVLGNEIGADKASELIENVKVNVVGNNIKGKRNIKKAVNAAANELGVELSDDQVNEIIGLMKRISKLDLDLNEIKTQLKDISGKIDKIVSQGEEVKSLLDKIIGFFEDLFSRLFG